MIRDVWRREPPLDRQTVDDIIRFLMGIDRKLERVVAILRGDDDEEVDA
jgi:hypothetical protein